MKLVEPTTPAPPEYQMDAEDEVYLLVYDL